MKKFIPLILAAALCLPFAAHAEDAVSSASVADFYGQTALTGDDLMNATQCWTCSQRIPTLSGPVRSSWQTRATGVPSS